MTAAPPPIAPNTCPHCGADNPPGATFCQSCGKALPAGAPSMPRMVSGPEYAQTAVGQQLQSDELQKQAKRAKGALLAVAIIATIGTGIFFALSQGAQGPAQSEVMFVVIATGVVAAIFWGLYVWSRSQPLPAAIAGLVIYGTLVAINVVTTVGGMANQEEGAGRGGLGIGCIDIIILAVLAQAIQAGVKHRKLMAQQSR